MSFTSRCCAVIAVLSVSRRRFRPAVQLGQWPNQRAAQLLATALLFQTHDKMSDAEAKARADLDLRWKAVAGHRLARLVQSGSARPGTSFGRAKTKFPALPGRHRGAILPLLINKLSVTGDPALASRIHQRRRGWNHSERQSPRRPVAHPATARLTKTAQ